MILILLLLSSSIAMIAAPRLLNSQANTSSSSSCELNSAQGNIQHVIYIQFDNVHFTRDNPNVPSDLEQMPALLNFIEQNGVLAANQHTPLISHTADDILTSLTGVYGDQMGQPVANSFGYFTSTGSVKFASSFGYWTDPVSNTYDPTSLMLTSNGLNAPAPWAPFTEAGCNVGAAGTANLELENAGQDLVTVFGANSQQVALSQTDYNEAYAEYVGISVHCAQSNAVCSTANGGVPDVLPNEPGGYSGYNALYGNAYVAPVISPSGPLTDLFGNVIQDQYGNVGFPGFDGMSAVVSLSYVAAMQEHGIPITYAYISDAHDNHQTGVAYGPGEAGYVAQLASYNQAFADFFARLQNDGITAQNTLFVISSDEGDQYVGPAPTPANCDGVTIPCTYNHSTFGEIDAYLTGLLSAQDGITTQFAAHFDSAPTIYVNGNPSATDTATRTLEQAFGTLTATNPYTGGTDKLAQFMAGPTEMNILHMVTADSSRTPTFTVFGDPNYYMTAGPSYDNYCSPGVYSCFDGYYAWNHGDVQSQIVTTWLGLVGPGVKHVGVDNSVWSDHADIRPTMMVLFGLKDSYSYEGYALVQYLDDWAIPTSLRGNGNSFISLAEAYKQINAPVGQFGLTTLNISTTALESTSPSDATYTHLESQLSNLATQRNALASQMITLLQAAEFSGQHINPQQAQSLVSQANALLQQASVIASQN